MQRVAADGDAPDKAGDLDPVRDLVRSERRRIGSVMIERRQKGVGGGTGLIDAVR